MDQSVQQNADYRLWILLGRTRDMLSRVRKKELRKYGITPIEARVLVVLNQVDNNTTPADLSRRVAREHITVMSLLRRMQKKQLVTMVKDPQKNTWQVSMTREGEVACEQALKLDSIRSAMSSLSETERHQLEQYLEKLYVDALRQLGTDSLLM